MQSVNLIRHVINDNASTHVFYKTHAPSMQNATRRITKRIADAHQELRAIRCMCVDQLDVSLMGSVLSIKRVMIVNVSILVFSSIPVPQLRFVLFQIIVHNVDVHLDLSEIH